MIFVGFLSVQLFPKYLNIDRYVDFLIAVIINLDSKSILVVRMQYYVLRSVIDYYVSDYYVSYGRPTTVNI